MSILKNSNTFNCKFIAKYGINLIMFNCGFVVNYGIDLIVFATAFNMLKKVGIDEQC